MPGELLLQVGAECLVLKVEVRVFETLAEAAATHGVDAADRERSSGPGDLRQLLRVILDSGRALRDKIRGEIGRRGRGIIARDE